MWSRQSAGGSVSHLLYMDKVSQIYHVYCDEHFFSCYIKIIFLFFIG